MREHEIFTQREQAMLMKLLVANYCIEHEPEFVENDEILGKTAEILRLYKVIGVAVTDIAKILASKP